MTRNIKYLILLIFCSLNICNGYSQTVEVVHDEQKEKQWRSMEIGPWDFAPDWYYYIMHKNYSGATAKWQWHGIYSGFKVSFHEDKSNVKRINPTRLISEETQRQKIKEVEKERAKFEELYRQASERQIDRMVDISYSSYEDDFNRMQDVITEGLTYCMKKSKGELEPAITKLTRRNEVICENIAYIHKTGVGYELENSKRQKAYEKARDEMKKIVNSAIYLAAVAQVSYK